MLGDGPLHSLASHPIVPLQHSREPLAFVQDSVHAYPFSRAKPALQQDLAFDVVHCKPFSQAKRALHQDLAFKIVHGQPFSLLAGATMSA